MDTETLKKICNETYNAVTSNGMRDMEEERFFQAVNDVLYRIKIYEKENYEPYFGWCDVSGCKNEGSAGGLAWRETGYWTTCLKHNQEWREGKPQPKMKKEAIEREKNRDTKTGCLKNSF